MKKILFLFLIAPLLASAQNFEYNILMHGIGDNREFFSEIATPQTILGTRGAAETGLAIDKHKMRIGASKLYEFGSIVDNQPTKLIIYYQYTDESKEFLMGAFERQEKLNFPLAMLTDTLLYYRPLVEGLYTKVEKEWGYEDIFVDWTKRQTDTIRENFTIGISGELKLGIFFINHYLILYHDANPRIQKPGDHIKDYIGAAVQFGARTNETAIVEAYAKIGLLNSNYRERNVTDGFTTGTSLFIEAYGKYKNIGLKSTLSAGDSHIFAQGDRFYHAKNYMRSDLIWYFINHKNVSGVFNYSFHLLNWNDIDQQQQLTIIYKFGGSKPLATHDNL